jgi:hypothetical protein
MRIFVLAFMLIVHAIFIGAAALAFFDFMSPRGAGTWASFLFIVITTVLGVPWSIGTWALGLTDSVVPWFGVTLNYCFLSWVTLSALHSTVDKQATEGADIRQSLPLVTKVAWGIVIPTVLFAGASLLLAVSIPHDRWERMGLVYFLVAAVPGIAVANWWLLPRCFPTRRQFLIWGLALPIVAALLEVIWLFNSNWIATRVHPIAGWFVTLLFLLPMVLSFLLVPKQARDPVRQTQ